ncbi:TPA: glycosyltransferase family 2 protein, partial [Campylobacter jejuni]|nr:glycosyltransferase family 2 protein [Campylobacter jejuni]
MKFKVGVIVPIYNVAKYLEECLKSIINQSYKNIFVVLVDDGSSDNSCEIAIN